MILRRIYGIPILATLLALAFTLAMAGSLEGQERQARARGGSGLEIQAEVIFSVGERTAIRDFYASNPQGGLQTLPPGMRKRLARGKPLPPGIAKQVLPTGLQRLLPVRDGYERVQVGLDVLLVEVATGIIHDVLMDVVR